MKKKLILLRFFAVACLSLASLVSFSDNAFAAQKCPFDTCMENCHSVFDSCKENQAGTTGPLQQCVYDWNNCKAGCYNEHDRDDPRCENATVPKPSLWEKFKSLVEGCTDWLFD